MGLISVSRSDLRERVARGRAELGARLALERSFLAEDARKAAARLRKISLAEILTPARRSGVAVILGAATAVAGLALWSLTVALVTAGIALVVYGAVVVDLDAKPPRGKGRKRVTRG